MQTVTNILTYQICFRRAVFDPELLDLDHDACHKIGQLVLTGDDLA
jgi:hypothetical protein